VRSTSILRVHFEPYNSSLLSSGNFAHVRVNIYEAALAFVEIGAGVALGYNSTRALGLIDKRLLDGYKKHATFVEDPERYNAFMSLIWGMEERKEVDKKAGKMMFN
jgi:salicylate hydroxylase